MIKRYKEFIRESFTYLEDIWYINDTLQYINYYYPVNVDEIYYIIDDEGIKERVRRDSKTDKEIFIGYEVSIGEYFESDTFRTFDITNEFNSAMMKLDNNGYIINYCGQEDIKLVDEFVFINGRKNYKIIFYIYIEEPHTLNKNDISI